MLTWSEYQNTFSPQMRRLARLGDRPERETDARKRHRIAAQLTQLAAALDMTGEEIAYLLAYHGYTAN